jgi:hypothetical protein
MDDDARARGTRGDELEQRAVLTALLATAHAAEGAASSEQQSALRLGRPERAGEAESALRGAPRRRLGQEAAPGACERRATASALRSNIATALLVDAVCDSSIAAARRRSHTGAGGAS